MSPAERANQKQSPISEPMRHWYQRVGGLGYGGDYNPEQWPRDIQDEDLELMGEARVNAVSLGVFAWGLLEPVPGSYEFEWLDDILDRLHAAGVSACLGTATATPPAWLAHQYPQTLPVSESGERVSFGSRGQFCPSSTEFRARAAALVSRLAARYGGHPALAMWHVGNEYSGECYCHTSAAAFRHWLADRYGDLDTLNAAWGTTVWSQQYRTWQEIQPPRTAMWNALRNPSQIIDYRRFTSAELLACYRAEADILRNLSPGVPVLTNFMESYKHLDYWAWAQVGDAVSLDSYPDPARSDSHVEASFNYDLMRSLGSGKPWLLLEQAVSAVAFRQVNRIKGRKMMRLGSFQAIARGADAVMAFQWRASRSGPEKFQTGMIPHGGTGTLLWREVRNFGHELESLRAVAGTRCGAAQVALVWDYENWWALEQPGRPAEIDYLQQVLRFYQPFWAANIAVDLVPPDADLTGYRLLVVPNLYLTTETAAKTVERFVQQGGHLVLSYFSDIVDGTDALRLGGYTTQLRDVIGVEIEDFSPLPAGGAVPIVGGEGDGLAGQATHWQDLIRLRRASALMTYADGELAGCAAVTTNGYGLGAATYLATRPDPATLGRLLIDAAEGAGVRPVASTPAGVEATVRVGPDQTFLFLLNHTDSPQQIELDTPGHDLLTDLHHDTTCHLPARDVKILRLEPRG